MVDVVIRRDGNFMDYEIIYHNYDSSKQKELRQLIEEMNEVHKFGIGLIMERIRQLRALKEVIKKKKVLSTINT